MEIARRFTKTDVECPFGCIYCYETHEPTLTDRYLEAPEEAEWVRKHVPTEERKNYAIQVAADSDIGILSPVELQKTLTPLVETGVNVYLATKAPIKEKSLQVLNEAARYLHNKKTVLVVTTTLTTMDDKFRKKIEPRAASIQKRISSIATNRNQDFYQTIHIGPLFPNVTDEELIQIINIAKENGTYLTAGALHLPTLVMNTLLSKEMFTPMWGDDGSHRPDYRNALEDLLSGWKTYRDPRIDHFLTEKTEEMKVPYFQSAPEMVIGWRDQVFTQ